MIWANPFTRSHYAFTPKPYSWPEILSSPFTPSSFWLCRRLRWPPPRSFSRPPRRSTPDTDGERKYRQKLLPLERLWRPRRRWRSRYVLIPCCLSGGAYGLRTSRLLQVQKRKSPRWISWSIQIPERRYYACMRRRVGAFASSSTLGIEIFVEGICSIWFFPGSTEMLSVDLITTGGRMRFVAVA